MKLVRVYYIQPDLIALILYVSLEYLWVKSSLAQKFHIVLTDYVSLGNVTQLYPEKEYTPPQLQ